LEAPEPSLEEELFAAFPHWRGIARTETDDEGCEYVVVAVPTPAKASVEHGLVVDTAHGEITVAFDFYHTHFHEYVGYGGHMGTGAAAAFIEDLMSEHVAVVSWWNAGAWCGSAQVEAGASVPVPSWAKAGTYDRVRVRSWEGTFNADSDALYLPKQEQ
jgi:hypothetical protein